MRGVGVECRDGGTEKEKKGESSSSSSRERGECGIGMWVWVILIIIIIIMWLILQTSSLSLRALNLLMKISIRSLPNFFTPPIPTPTGSLSLSLSFHSVTYSSLFYSFTNPFIIFISCCRIKCCASFPTASSPLLAFLDPITTIPTTASISCL